MKNIYLFLLMILLQPAFCISQGSWSTIPNAPIDDRFDDINFVNDSTGFISQASKVYKTSDKGNTWTQIATLDSLYDYIRSVEFINDSIGFIGLLQSNSTFNSNMYKTTNGGYSWTMLQNMQIGFGDGICGMAHYGNRLVAVGTYSGQPWVYRSDDFGSSWLKVDLSNLMLGLVDCYMLSPDTILVSGIADSSNNYNGSIVKSYDGGLTWTRVYLSNTPYNDFCWKMFFRPGGLGIASVESFGPIMAVARTTDYGDTWSTVIVDTTSFQGHLGGIALLNDTLGWVFDQHNFGTWETHDGGLTWNMIITPVLAGNRLVVLDSLTVLAAGSTVYRYNLGTVGIADPVVAYVPLQNSLTVYPNPAQLNITIDAIAVKNTFGLLFLTDATGKMVKRISRQLFIKGKNSFSISVKDLPAGNYTAIWHSNETVASKRFTVVH